MSVSKFLFASVLGLGVMVSTVSVAGSSNTNASTPVAAQNAEVTTKVNINQASQLDLMKVEGMTTSKAKALLSYRKQHGDFKSLDELKDVKGFKRGKNLKNIIDQLTVG